MWIEPTSEQAWKLLIWMMILGCAALGVVLFCLPLVLDWDQWALGIKLRVLGMTLWGMAAGIFGLLWAAERFFDR